MFMAVSSYRKDSGEQEIQTPRGCHRRRGAGGHIGDRGYGIVNGKPFAHVIKGQLVGKYQLSGITATPDQTVRCTEYISDVSKENGNHPFKWETMQTCSGPFGDQYMATQMWRSSYLEPVGYGGWAYSPHTSNGFTSENWSIGCNYGKGEYNYYPVMYGWTVGLGQGPTIRSDNTLDNDHCGPNPP
jgi:hypothetical protein